MIAANSTGEPMSSNDFHEQVEHRVCAIVVAHSYTGDEARLAINEAVYDNFESYESYQ